MIEVPQCVKRASNLYRQGFIDFIRGISLATNR